MRITENTKGLVGSMVNIDAVELSDLINDRDRYKKALEEIINAPKSKQYDQLKNDYKTYDGLSFGNLQQIAKRALK